MGYQKLLARFSLGAVHAGGILQRDQGVSQSLNPYTGFIDQKLSLEKTIISSIKMPNHHMNKYLQF